MALVMMGAPWDVITRPSHKGMIKVAGDAMHPMAPDLGQGLVCSFRGCTSACEEHGAELRWKDVQL